MGRIKSKLGCASSLFRCFGSSKKKKHDADDIVHDDGAPHRQATNGQKGIIKNNTGSVKRVTIKEGSIRQLGVQSPHSDIASVTSGKSSVYFDASEGESDAWYSINGDSFDDDSFISLQLDGQYFFSAKDDPNISKEAFEGIQMYPPLPTTEVDPIPRSPISVSNMDTLLASYQHSGDDIELQKSNEEADIAAGKAGIALEHQAQRLMMPEKEKSLEYLGESTDLLLKELSVKNVRERGFPGELTEAELEAVKLFRNELQTRDPIYNQIVRAMSAVEKEAYALCRFLRARKFDVDKTFELLDEAKEHFAKARDNDFYPDLEQALGFQRPVFLSQYPAVFSGNAKNGCPVMYLQIGRIQPDGIKCIVSFDEIERYFWNDTIYTWVDILKQGKRLNPQFVRTENITVYDLKGASRSQVTSETFDLIKVGNQVMSSFPETLHCLLIINAPGWFGMVWNIVKKLIDARTASKIEVLTSSKASAKRMRELIDESQIPSCYGGTGQSLIEAASGSNAGDTKNKMVVLNQLLPLTKKKPENEFSFDVEDSKPMTLAAYTRCKEGATATLLRINDTDSTLSKIDVVGDKDDGRPYNRTIGTLTGPGTFTVKLKAKSDPGPFLILGSVSA